MTVTLLVGDCRDLLRTLDSGSVHCAVTSPPYFGLRDYGVAGQIGLEESLQDYIDELVAVFAELRRVLRDDGTLWLNLGDSYSNVGKWGGSTSGKHVKALHGEQQSLCRERRDSGALMSAGLKPKDLMMVPARVALALQADGWTLRSEIVWHKPNPMPESVTDRPTVVHEKLFLLSKSQRYYYDADAVREPDGDRDHKRRVLTPPEPSGGLRPAHTGLRTYQGRNGCGRNLRNVWTVPTRPFGEAHFATFPPELIEPCIKAGCPEGGTVLDPFGGAGTTGLVADRLGRDAILIELNPAYAEIARRRLQADGGMFANILEERKVTA